MIKQVIELLLVVIIGMLPAGAERAQTLENKDFSENSVIMAEVSSQADDGVKAARFQNMLNHNLCYGGQFSKEDVKTSCAVALRALIKDGFIDKTAVDRFALDMYGVSLAEEPSQDGLYAVPALGFDEYFHTVESFEYNGDGTVTVKSVMSVNGEGAVPVTSVFFADGTSTFGYTLVSCIAEW